MLHLVCIIWRLCSHEGKSWHTMASELLCWSLDSFSDLIQTSLFLGMELREAWMWPGMRWRNWTCYPILWWSTCSSPPTAPASWFRRRTKTRLSPPRRRGWEHGRNAVPLFTSRWHYRVGKNLVALLFFSFWDFPWFLKFCFLKKKMDCILL